MAYNNKLIDQGLLVNIALKQNINWHLKVIDNIFIVRFILLPFEFFLCISFLQQLILSFFLVFSLNSLFLHWIVQYLSPILGHLRCPRSRWTHSPCPLWLLWKLLQSWNSRRFLFGHGVAFLPNSIRSWLLSSYLHTSAHTLSLYMRIISRLVHAFSLRVLH